METTPRNLHSPKLEDGVSLPPLSGSGLSLPRAVEAIQAVMLPEQRQGASADRPFTRPELERLSEALTQFRSRLLDHHQDEFALGAASAQLRRVLEWCTTALRLTQQMIAQTAEEEERRKEGILIPLDTSSGKKTFSLFDRVQQELRAAKEERERLARDDERRGSFDRSRQSREAANYELARKAATLSFQTQDLALIGELKLLLQANQIPSEQIDDVLRLIEASTDDSARLTRPKIATSRIV